MEIKDIIEKVEAKLISFKDSVNADTAKEVKSLNETLTALKETEFKALKDDLVAKGATIGQLQEEVKQLKAARARFGAGAGEVTSRPSVMGEIAKVIAEKKDALAAIEKGGRLEGNFEIKSPGVVLSTSLASGSYIDYLDWRPGMEPTGQYRIRELVRTVSSAFDVVYFPVANTPVGQGSFGRQAAEGNTKAQVDRGYTMTTVNLTPMAAYIQVSRQSLRNIPFLQTWLPTSLNEQLLDTEDLDFMSKIVSAATGVTTTATPGGTSITVAAERFIYLIKNARQAKYVPNGIACDPGVWAEVLTTKPQNYSTPLGYNIAPDGAVRIMGIPLFPANWLTGGRVICADWTKAQIIESEALSFRQSDNVGTTFIQNEITFLLERTNNIGVNRPDAFQTTTFA